MIWGKYLTLYSLSFFKFMFAPLGGIPMKLSFIETYLACTLGALTSASFFFFLSEYFISRANRKRREKEKQAIEKGIQYIPPKKFTFTNKLIVKTKRIFGIYGICLWAPLFLSIPLGSIVSAKFYGKKRKCFPLIALGIFINGFIITSIVYLKEFIG